MRNRKLRAALAGCAVVTFAARDVSAVVVDHRPEPDVVQAPEPGEIRPALLRGRIFTAFDEDDPARAIVDLEQYLERRPEDGLMLYNAACAHSLLGNLDVAEEYLRKAIKAGFIDCSQFRRDPDIAPLRDRPVLKAILAARDAADQLLADRAVREWKESHGDHYRLTTDEQRRINLLTALDETTHTQLMLRVQRQADHLAEVIFGMPLRHFVLVVLAAEDDSLRIFENPSVSGHYHHLGRRVVVADINPSMPHELVHAFHNCHMDHVGQDHPIWIREGLATLYETYRFGDDGAIDYVTNDRDVLVATLESRDELVPWRELFTMNSRQFKFRADERYAQVRTIFEFLADRGRLRDWYELYTARFAEDRTGALAMEELFAAPLAEVEQRWRDWLLSRPLDETRVVLDLLPPSMKVIHGPCADEDHDDEVDQPAPAPSTVREALMPPLPPPTELELTYERGRSAYAEGAYDRAASLFVEVTEAEPDHADAHYQLGLTLVRLGRLERARARMQTLESLDPSLASLLENLVGPAPATPRSSYPAPRCPDGSATVLDPDLRILPPHGPAHGTSCSPQRGCDRPRVVPSETF